MENTAREDGRMKAKVFLAIPTWQGTIPFIDLQIKALGNQIVEVGQSDFEANYLVNNTNAEGLALISRKAKQLNGRVHNLGQISFPMELVNLWNYAAERLLMGNYTHLWILGGDNIPIPETHFATLLEADKDVIAAAAFLKDAMLPVTNIFDTKREDYFTPFLPAYELPVNQSFRLKEGIGSASCLIKRQVLEKIVFRFSKTGPCLIDYPFSQDIREHGFDLYSSTELWVNHSSETTGQTVSLAKKFQMFNLEFEAWRSKLNWNWQKWSSEGPLRSG